MNLRRLEYFSVLAQVGNLGKAAEMLHISAPALSKAMKVLEEEMEAKLWIRDGRKIILTDLGKALCRRTQTLMGDLRKVKEDLLATDPRRPIRIGTFEVFSTYFLSFL